MPFHLAAQMLDLLGQLRGLCLPAGLRLAQLVDRGGQFGQRGFR